jgi:hypothetical protein
MGGKKKKLAREERNEEVHGLNEEIEKGTEEAFRWPRSDEKASE